MLPEPRPAPGNTFAAAPPAGISAAARTTAGAAPPHPATQARGGTPWLIAKSRADAVWEGSLTRGSGTVSLASGAAEPLPVTWVSRTNRGAGATSPEELVAAAHASCFCMALSGELAENGTPPDKLEASATVTFAAVEGGSQSGELRVDREGRRPWPGRSWLCPDGSRRQRRLPHLGRLKKGNVEINSDGDAHLKGASEGTNHRCLPCILGAMVGLSHGGVRATGRTAAAAAALLFFALALVAARAPLAHADSSAWQSPFVLAPGMGLNEQYGYAPAYTRNVPSFDAENRAYIRSRTATAPTPPTCTR